MSPLSIAATVRALDDEGVVMVTVVVVSRKLRINPDNVATPVAGSLGDLTATAVLAFFANVFYNYLYLPGAYTTALLSSCVHYTRTIGGVRMCRSVVGAAAGGRVRAGAHARIREHRAPQPVHAASGLRRLDPSRVRRLHLQLRRLDLLARRQHARYAACY